LGTLWLKIKVWTKVFIVFALLVYAVVFVYQNSARPVKPWFWFGREPDTSVLVLFLCSFLLGVVGTILSRTTIKTLRQFRNLRERTRAERLEREMADMRTKAALLRSKGPAEAGEDGAAGEAELP
jgi:hypothetical protein